MARLGKVRRGGARVHRGRARGETSRPATRGLDRVSGGYEWLPPVYGEIGSRYIPAGRGGAGHGPARRGRVRQGLAWLGMARAEIKAWHGMARHGQAWLGAARFGTAWHGRKSRLGMARECSVGQSRARAFGGGRGLRRQAGGRSLDCGFHRSDGICAGYPVHPSIPYILILTIPSPSIPLPLGEGGFRPRLR